MKKIIAAILAAFLLRQSVYAQESICYGFDGERGNFSSIEAFEKNYGSHDIYTFFVEDENSIPYMGILECSLSGKTPLISFSHNCDIEKCAQSLGKLHIEFIGEICPLTASENMTKEEYISFFQTSASALKKYAPKSRTLYSFSLNDIERGIEYFPESYYADITGFIIYSNENKNILYPVLQTQKAYGFFESKTDIIISRFAVSHFSTNNPSYQEKDAAQCIKSYYSYVKENMPNISAIIYSNKYLYINKPYLRYTNDYTVTTSKIIGEGYKYAAHK